jgi:hypothetical protein
MPDRAIKFTMTPDTDYWFYWRDPAGRARKLKPQQWKSYWQSLSPEEYEKTARPMSAAEIKKLDAEMEKWTLDDIPDVRIRGSGKQGRQRRQIDPELYRRFAKIGTGLDLLNFIKKFGRLTNEEGGDAVEELLDEAKRMQHSVAWGDKHKRPPPTTVSNLKATVSLNYKTRRIEQTIFPQTLLQALWLQFIYTPIGVGKLRKCQLPDCGEQFWAGPGTNRRGDADFCCHEHQVLFNSRKRSNPEMEKGK